MLQPEVLNLNSVLSGMDKMFRLLLGEDIELSLSMQHDLGMVLADRGQIEQVVMNLVVNARDAMPNGGKLSIAARNADLPVAQDRVGFGALGGPCIALTVSDTGSGMDEVTRSRIFEPFFTTKDRHKGTGLGLSTVLGIVQQSGGYISVHSQPGQGTTFETYLPRSLASGEPSATQPPPASLLGVETILLVEDDEQVRTLARSVLLRHGYKVLAAANGGEALLIVEGHPSRIDMVVTDVIMPLMSGKQLVDRLVLSRPGIKVLFMSGYTDDAIVSHGVLDAGIHFLQKPLTPGALTRKVREVLDAETPLSSPSFQVPAPFSLTS
jgi:two-component system cell cycle sensor histidine kinase/response regulator CckA